MSKQQVTIKDIARKLRISVSTVSRALRDLPDVNPETKVAVKALAEELNYEPNYIAQSLINRRSRIIGVIVPVISAPVFGRILEGMHDAAHLHGYQLMLCQSNENSASEAALVRQLIAFKVEGLVISVSGETKNAASFEVLKKKEIPIVFFDRVLSDIDASKIIVDEYKSALMAVEHLINIGCRQLCHLAGPPDLSISIDRLNGYLSALKKHNLPINEKFIINCCKFEEDALKATKQLFSEKSAPDGIFAINDKSAIIAINFLRKKGIKIPEDVAIVGFNNDPISEVVRPTLTSIMEPGYEIGSETIEMVIKHIENPKFPPQIITLHSKLIKRESTKRSPC
ncbi:MAG TPA: LacI family DNA-binding transcriptional regulator [Chitinophagaceae bacterium]